MWNFPWHFVHSVKADNFTQKMYTCTWVGWKVCRLTKKELCHSCETWHGLNSAFPNTINCIVSFQINPHWISNFRTLKSSTRDILETAWKTDKGSPVSPGQCSCTQVCGCMQWLLCMTAALNRLITLNITIWLFSVPQHDKTFGWEAVLAWWWGLIFSWGLLWGSGWELLYDRNPSAATPMEEVCGPQRRLYWNINHIWSNSTIAS